MDIVGIGSQIVDCTRVRKLIDRHGEIFLAQVFTEAEMRYCNSRTHVTENYTAIWAAKEAVLRSLGTKWQRGMAWTDMEIRCERGRGAVAAVGGATASLMKKQGATSFLLTMAHCRAFATATCLAVKGDR